MEFGDFAMMRRMLHGIKERAEALVVADCPGRQVRPNDPDREASAATLWN